MQKEISMKHTMNSLLAIAGLACALAIPAGLSAQSGAPPPPQPGQGRMQTQFPGLREAHQHLTAANDALARANWDYGEHKEKAMELIRQAQEELEQAKEYAQSHR
jgi:hypothetical protein